MQRNVQAIQKATLSNMQFLASYRLYSHVPTRSLMADPQEHKRQLKMDKNGHDKMDMTLLWKQAAGPSTNKQRSACSACGPWDCGACSLAAVSSVSSVSSICCSCSNIPNASTSSGSSGLKWPGGSSRFPRGRLVNNVHFHRGKTIWSDLISAV